MIQITLTEQQAVDILATVESQIRMGEEDRWTDSMLPSLRSVRDQIVDQGGNNTSIRLHRVVIGAPASLAGSRNSPPAHEVAGCSECVVRLTLCSALDAVRGRFVPGRGGCLIIDWFMRLSIVLLLEGWMSRNHAEYWVLYSRLITSSLITYDSTGL